MNLISLLKKRGMRVLLYKFQASVFPKDDSIKSLCAREGAYKYLKKYEPLLDNFQYKSVDPEDGWQPTIWVCWLQGLDNAPLLVKKCVESIQSHAGNKKVVILDKSNLSEYIDLPSHIICKYEAGIFSHTFFSDYVRIAMLKKYGGIWIDSTTYLTDEIPSYISDSDMFCFKVFPIGKVHASSWFIAAKKGNPIIAQMECLLNEYWRRENTLVTYSVIHLFMTMVINHNDENRRMWSAIPYFPDENCKVMQNELFDVYSEKRFKQLCDISSIHKLTYKFPNNAAKVENTNYQQIIGGF